MLKRFGKVYGIDLGTSNTVIFEKGKGIMLNEPSVVAIDQRTSDLIAVGAEAQAMVGRAPEHVEVTYPLKNGVIANIDMTSSMIQQFIKKMQARSFFLSSAQVYISVPCGITNVQKRAVEQTVVRKGANRAIAVEGPLAAALGAGIEIEKPLGRLILDIGGGSCQLAVLSLGGIVTSHKMQRAGMSIDQDIMEYVKKQYNMEIGERTAEKIKREIGSVNEMAAVRILEVRGRDVVHGLPRSIQLSSDEIYEVINEFVTAVVEAVRTTLEQCPPELAGDVLEQGMLLCGGGSLLDGLAARIRSDTGVPVLIAERPLECAALGTGMMLDKQAGSKTVEWRETVREDEATSN
ncbi:rod shape-determining protein [Paenibacillus hexagrammi]|uniref:Cell shape-determining protein MreB n=1 Tax=Paenibacillus hexagrammi TaxID=2908839 RepID=A0ABY3SHQ0_9BACL|nr:rod shape-determining protein [Paenibacillus sp. YPD9-1]UJF32754.1 rod shape-determining protein [Paenibacillus sp. YPD9-1]